MESSVAHYNLLEQIGEGGLGPVYRARDTRTGRTVALKLVPSTLLADAVTRAQFFADGAAASTLSHPSIATLFDVGDHEGGAYLAYEFVPGATIAEEMAGHPLAPRRALEIAIQIADALAEGHAVGHVHGDVRPGNILITPKGTAKLLEFGMSRWTNSGRTRTRASAAVQPVGSDALSIVAYMSPEQALGSTADGRSDVFSLAIVVYETLTGRNPFAGADTAATVLNVIQAPAAPPSTVNRELPAAVDAVLGRALSKEIHGRPDGAASFAAQLRKMVATLEMRARDAGPPPGVTIDDDTSGAGTWIALVVALAAVALLIWYAVS